MIPKGIAKHDSLNKKKKMAQQKQGMLYQSIWNKKDNLNSSGTISKKMWA